MEGKTGSETSWSPSGGGIVTKHPWGPNAEEGSYKHTFRSGPLSGPSQKLSVGCFDDGKQYDISFDIEFIMYGPKKGIIIQNDEVSVTQWLDPTDPADLFMDHSDPADPDEFVCTGPCCELLKNGDAESGDYTALRSIVFVSVPHDGERIPPFHSHIQCLGTLLLKPFFLLYTSYIMFLH